MRSDAPQDDEWMRHCEVGKETYTFNDDELIRQQGLSKNAPDGSFDPSGPVVERNNRDD
jgi:hypothetical protein